MYYSKILYCLDRNIGFWGVQNEISDEFRLFCLSIALRYLELLTVKRCILFDRFSYIEVRVMIGFENPLFHISYYFEN